MPTLFIHLFISTIGVNFLIPTNNLRKNCFATLSESSENPS